MSTSTSTSGLGEHLPPNFYERVWALVGEVPRGRVVTYGQV
ncbi:MAG: MGMT family protein, partial [Dehalococcoidia bacterium]|nr:MGMT family protein [Dehalococcoidia bacterium]